MSRKECRDSYGLINNPALSDWSARGGVWAATPTPILGLMQQGSEHRLETVGRWRRQGQLAIQNRRRPRQAEETVPSVRVTRATSEAARSRLSRVGAAGTCLIINRRATITVQPSAPNANEGARLFGR
jgi:hypothetical protein